MSRVLFGKLEFCTTESVPYDLDEAYRQLVLTRIRQKHPKAVIDRNTVVYNDWKPATPKQLAAYEVKKRREQQQKAAEALRVAKHRERTFNQLVIRAKRLGYQLVPLTK